MELLGSEWDQLVLEFADAYFDNHERTRRGNGKSYQGLAPVCYVLKALQWVTRNGEL